MVNFKAFVASLAQRYVEAAASDNKPRQRAHDLTQPINKPRGIDRDIVKENGVPDPPIQESATPARRDIQPQDVFAPSPKNTGVLNLALTGEDLSHAIDKTIPKDKGYETVSNLSQYLIETEGGGEGGPVKRK